MRSVRIRKSAVFWIILLAALAVGLVWEAGRVKISSNKETITVGRTVKLTIWNTDQKVIWSSDNEEIAAVSGNGIVTGISAGTARITGSIADNGNRYTCKITVLEEGVYTASARGRNGNVSVTLTFSDNKITAVSIDIGKETVGIGTSAAAVLKEKILEEQSAEAEAVSGATITSRAITNAAAKCISQAIEDGYME